jgi:putative sterol carrier protein
MANSHASTAFLEELGRRGHDPRLARTTGTLRFDVRDDARMEHWRLAIEDGVVAVSRDDAAADCVLRIDRDAFDALATGELNPMVATLRGVLVPEGDVELMVRFQRILPDPPTRLAATTTRTVGRQRS